ncbi:6538_t:CDS:2 [Ambispora leptoticha]|uniref:6538_t:CDS:1 n=1 Tax=Ambispora leptoticha TaxID=144679 RepID=A0A9N8V918_9GLOM|nr:6538_t:CDS:2 [Ambispora leptoticha]
MLIEGRGRGEGGRGRGGRGGGGSRGDNRGTRRGFFNSSLNYRGGRQAYNNGFAPEIVPTDNAQSGENKINLISTEPQINQENSNDSLQFNRWQPGVQRTNAPNNTSRFNFKDRRIPRRSKPHFERDTQPRIKVKLETPEEIAKWIEERKKRYPTDANIAKKKQEEEERAARGELIPGTNARLRDKRRGNLEWRTDNRQKRPRLNQNRSLRPENFDDTKPGIDILIAAESAAPVGQGTNLNEACISIKSESVDNDDVSTLSSHNKNEDNDNASTLNRINKNDDNDDSVQPLNRHNNRFAHVEKTTCKYYRNGYCKNGNKCRYRHDEFRKGSQSKDEVKSRRSGNLLRMLLEKEIRKERNILLQSIRYIVDKNFFQVVSNDSLEAAKRRNGPSVEELQTTEDNDKVTCSN